VLDWNKYVFLPASGDDKHARHLYSRRGQDAGRRVTGLSLGRKRDPQYLAVEKELGLERDKTNVNGGAISIGHPLAASGARLTITLMHELRRNHLKYGVASLCIGGGQGIAAVIENVVSTVAQNYR